MGIEYLLTCNIITITTIDIFTIIIITVTLRKYVTRTIFILKSTQLSEYLITVLFDQIQSTMYLPHSATNTKIYLIFVQ